MTDEYITVTWPGGDLVKVRPGSLGEAIARGGVMARAMRWAKETAASIADDQERALVEQVIETVAEGRRLPSWNTMTPLMQAVTLALQGKTRPWEDDE